MSLWLVRAGKYGEHEDKFLNDDRIYCTWHELADQDLSSAESRHDIVEFLRVAFPEDSDNRLGNWASQIWAFVGSMEMGDWVVLPRKQKPAIAVAEIKSGYRYDENAEPDYVHSREVEWLNKGVPRSVFDQDLLYSFGAFMTICQISRNDAEKRVHAIAEAGWRSEGIGRIRGSSDTAVDTDEEAVDLSLLARDEIAKLLARKFKGHAMARLVEDLLRVEGYTTFRSPEGPDKGVDILAAPGPLGFGTPRIAVQVKSGDIPVDRPTLDQLIGAMQNVQAEHGLLVSWGGYRSSIDKETAHHFFRVRLWDQDDLIDQLLTHYSELNDELKTELPLKRIWTVAYPEES